MKLIATLLLTVLLTNLGRVAPVFALLGAPPVSDPFEFMPTDSSYTASQFRSPEDFVGTVINIFLGIAISVSVLGILFSGIKIAWSKGDAKSTAAAREYLNYSIRALLFSLAAITLEYIIRDTLGATGVGIGLP